MTLDKLDQDMVDAIAEHGWFGVHVLEEEGLPGFSYSIGFWESVGAPDFLIYGLPKDLTHSMMWELFRQLKAGLAVEDGARVSNLLEGCDCIIRPIHESHFREHLGSAIWYRHFKLGHRDGLRAWQVFWPGRQQGLFPWEPGCDATVRVLQPPLYLPDEKGIV